MNGWFASARLQGALAVFVSWALSSAVVLLVQSQWLEPSLPARALRYASRHLTQLYLAHPRNENDGPPPVTVVLLSRSSIDDHAVSGSKERVLDQQPLLNLVRLIANSGASAIVLDYDMGADQDDFYRDPENDRWFLDSLLAISQGRWKTDDGRTVPVVVGVGSRSFDMPESRLGEPHFAGLAVSLLLPGNEDEAHSHQQVAWVSVEGDRLPAATLWAARQISPGLDPERSRLGLPLLERSAIPNEGAAPDGAVSYDTVAYFQPDYSTLSRLVAKSIPIDTIAPGPRFSELRGQVVMISHRELDPRAYSEGEPIGDERFRRSHLLAAGAITLANRPVWQLSSEVRQLLEAGLFTSGLFLMLWAVYSAARGQQERRAVELLDFRIAAAIASLLFVGCGAFLASTRIALDELLVVPPLVVLGSYLQLRAGRWIQEWLRPGGRHAH